MRQFSFQSQFSSQTETRPDIEIVHKLVEAIKQADGQIKDWIGGDDDSARFVNLCVYSENPREFWTRVRRDLELSDNSTNLLTMIIVVCQGDRGWDDYLLLHHYDQNQKIDVLM